MNSKDILKIIGAELGGTAVHSGPNAAARLAARYGMNELAADGIVSYYQWQHRLQHAPGFTTPAQIAELVAARHEPEPAPMTKETLRAEIEQSKQRDEAATRRYMADLRAKIESMKEPERDPESEWEAQQRARELLDDVIEHEAAHATVTLALGCKISEVVVNADGSGHVAWAADLPEKARLPVSVAGTLHHQSGLFSPGADGDRQSVENEIDRRWPNCAPLDREYLRARVLNDADGYAESLLGERWEFKRALKDRLHAERRVSGPDVHELWDAIYFNEE